ncbi:MAG: bifunctional precorrin-2 dehydrogenase/sirohydrochlorin ferrochelatase [Peptococcaceae bacterium]|nr:bifunctional precorrin-2 dehydrogenase/sirohydrochlorin ferrochelatase [Peptococcaceae bacterium]
MNTYPVALKLAGRLCLVVGGGKVGERKVASLLASGAAVRLVSPAITKRLMGWARQGPIEWRQRAFQEEDLENVMLAIAATDDYEVNWEISRLCDERHILVNVVDIPELCSFYVPAILRRGLLSIMVSTAGASPALARRIRDMLGEVFPPVYSKYLELLAGWRRRAFADIPDAARREAFLKHMVDDVTMQLMQDQKYDLLKERLEDVYRGYGSQPPRRPR